MNQRSALFVDLSNFYSRLLKSGIEEPDVLRDYFLHWLDFDLLAATLTDASPDVWIFYSNRGVGPSDTRIKNSDLNEYIRRINCLRGVTARDVNIPGEQREPVTVKCHKCQEENPAEWRSEKGIDASLTVHLFDTMDSWNMAYLLSGDADYVPAVASLRRRGKIVVGAGFADASPALIRECYDYINLSDAFLADDVRAYMLFRPVGTVQMWFEDVVRCAQDYQPFDTVRLDLTISHEEVGVPQHDYQAIPRRPSCVISLTWVDGIDFSSRNEMIERMWMKPRHRSYVRKLGKAGYEFTIGMHAWESIERRLGQLTSSIPGLYRPSPALDPGRWCKSWKYEPETQQYRAVLEK